MKKLSIALVLFCLYLNAFTQVLTGKDAAQILPGASKIWIKNPDQSPAFIQLSDQASFKIEALDEWLTAQNRQSAQLKSRAGSRLKDILNWSHTRYQQYFEEIPVEDAHFIVHVFNGRVKMLNGLMYRHIAPANTVMYTRDEARSKALDFIGGTRYKWEIPGEEALLKSYTANPDASYFPAGELVLFPVSNQPGVHVYAYKYDIYADKPLRRAEVFVDAQTGTVLFANDQIHHTDTPGTAITAYSGEQSIITDSFSEGYRLRESGRGDGIETYDMNESTDYADAVDFTDPDNTWNNVNASLDQYATDAHWGAEMTYDYYKLKHNRNSIDDQGFKLRSYVHYDQGYANAFWDGQRMTYGDGDGNWSPLTALDICGHEITHGLTSYTADLVYSYESGALNEAYSDIFGTAIEFYGKPTMANWLLGENIGSPLRSLSNPGQYDQPDTYLGNDWYTGSGDNGGVHTNSGVLNFWYYLLCQGGSGTNDNGDAYVVNAIGMDEASAIAFRTLTVYLIPSSQYDDARFYSILSAIDLFGGCSAQVESTTNAFYAVGIGNAYTPDVVADFTASSATFCSLPAQVFFSNNSINGISYSWDFGDGTGSTQANPVHNYTNGGIFSVKLSVDGGPCGTDTLVMMNLINVNLPQAPQVTNGSTCSGPPASFTLLANAPDTVRWFTSPTGGTSFFTGTSYTTPMLTQSTHYYVENQVISAPSFGGKPNNTGGGGYFSNFNQHWLVFNANQDITIKSVKVYADGAGVRNIELRDASGNVLQNANINIQDGESRITLNFNVPAGTDYQLAGPGTPDLYRNNGGCNYPYNINGLATITESSAGTNPTGYYYYFYDWEVSPSECISERVKVSAWINSGNPVASFTSFPYALHCNFTSTSVDANEYLWDFGDGNSSTQQNPIHIYNAPGLYTVNLTVTNACGSDVTSQTVNILATGVADQSADPRLLVDPNPASESIRIQYTGVVSDNMRVQLLELSGKVILNTEYSASTIATGTLLDVSHLPKGAYILKCISGETLQYRKLILQ